MNENLKFRIKSLNKTKKVQKHPRQVLLDAGDECALEEVSLRKQVQKKHQHQQIWAIFGNFIKAGVTQIKFVKHKSVSQGSEYPVLGVRFSNFSLFSQILSLFVCRETTLFLFLCSFYFVPLFVPFLPKYFLCLYAGRPLCSFFLCSLLLCSFVCSLSSQVLSVFVCRETTLKEECSLVYWGET